MKEYSILELQRGLEAGEWTSVDLVTRYIEQIKLIDQQGPQLNSIAEINPEVYEIAGLMDKERIKSGPRSLLHGIPVVLKDNINTGDKMHTSASSIALADYYAPEDAFIVKKLREAGAIILGKANMSEFAYFMSYDDMPSGYGSRFGQVKSPYGPDIDPLGSSTGSAVSVASNLIPVSIGTETNGSLMAPAQQNSIVAIKPSLGLVSRTGIIPITHFQDTAGPMARTVEDAAILLDHIWGMDPQDQMTKLTAVHHYDFSQSYMNDIDNYRIGFLYFENQEYEDEEIKYMKEAKKILEPMVKAAIELKTTEKEIPNLKTLVYEFKVDINHYFSQMGSACKIRSLKDLIDFNRLDPQKRLKFGQSIFEESEATSGTLKEPEYIETRKKVVKNANQLNEIMVQYDLDVIIMPQRTSHAPCAGNPIITVPAKSLVDNQPRSLFFVAKNYEDQKCIQVAYHYEQATKRRIKPYITFLG